MINSRSRAVTSIFLVVAFMSTGSLMIKLSDWPAIPLTAARSFISALVFLVYLRRPNLTWSRAQIGGAAAYALMLFTFVQAVKWTTAANAIFLQYTSPIWVALFSIWLLNERPTRVDWAAMLAVALGMFLFFGQELTPSGFWGNILALFSGICMAFFLIGLRLQKDGSPTETVFLGNLMAAVVGLPFILLADLPINGREMSIFLYLGIFQLGIPYVVVTLAIIYLSAMQVVLIKTLVPVLTPIWVYLIIGEEPAPLSILGGIIVATAVVLRTVWAGRRQRQGKSERRAQIEEPYRQS